ncbi:MAG TPA: hypothetical protein ENN99_00660 [Chloroflexi bacterium]|nr:hypothetical protein [Chloroflexota bacterium]
MTWRPPNRSLCPLAQSTYEAGRRLNGLEARRELASPAMAAETEQRIKRAVTPMAQIDDPAAGFPIL